MATFRARIADFFHYPPVDEQQMKWGVYLTGGGHLRVKPNSSYPPALHPSLYQFIWGRGRVLPEFALLYIKSGRGQFESELTGSVKLSPGNCIILFPGIWHRYRPLVTTGWTELWITMSGRQMHGLIDAGMIKPDRAICKPTDIAGFQKRFERLLAGLRQHHTKALLTLGIQGLALVAEAAEEAFTAKGSEIGNLHGGISSAVVGRALEVIWTASHRSLSILQVADAVGVSRRTLERRFKIERGRSVHDEIIYCRLNRARRLLDETDLPIKSVAYLAGFANGERFRTSLRAMERITPRAFRARPTS